MPFVIGSLLTKKSPKRNVGRDPSLEQPTAVVLTAYGSATLTARLSDEGRDMRRPLR